ncbi:MAG: bis(5'-nucleosyl)-tetraphosphatase (symmetrical) YqeK [Clostridia bacterium]|nr:bis(5'-nucleosyl)-tetraphosphatase (symmetrical) YqeK [Clostridia bacterium]
MNIENLRQAVRPYLKEKRYLHTLAVEKEAAALGEIFLPDKIESLRTAALLHDITKKEDITKQLQYCAEFGIIVAEEEKFSPKIFHARTAAAVAKRDFPEWVDEEILNGVRYHTTGRADMTVFEAIVYLADYIEETRTFPDCITLRQYFYENIEKASDTEEKLAVLTDTMILSFDMTLRNLMEENAPIDSDTIAARNFYVYKKLSAGKGRPKIQA